VHTSHHTREQEILQFQDDQSADVRKQVIAFVEAACKKDAGLLPRVSSSTTTTAQHTAFDEEAAPVFTDPLARRHQPPLSFIRLSFTPTRIYALWLSHTAHPTPNPRPPQAVPTLRLLLHDNVAAVKKRAVLANTNLCVDLAAISTVAARRSCLCTFAIDVLSPHAAL
jgi:hypothetical protein